MSCSWGNATEASSSAKHKPLEQTATHLQPIEALCVTSKISSENLFDNALSLYSVLPPHGLHVGCAVCAMCLLV